MNANSKPVASASMREEGAFQLMARDTGRALLARPPEFRVFDITANSEASLFINEEQARAIYADLHAMFGDAPFASATPAPTSVPVPAEKNVSRLYDPALSAKVTRDGQRVRQELEARLRKEEEEKKQ